MAHIMQVFRTGWFILKKLTLAYIQISPAIPDTNWKHIGTKYKYYNYEPDRTQKTTTSFVLPELSKSQRKEKRVPNLCHI